MAGKSAAAKGLKVGATNEAPYMGDEHVAEFSGILEAMLRECETGSRAAMQSLREENERSSDAADCCDLSLQREENKKLADRLSRRRAEIESSLLRLKSGEYGYCEETGDEIGLPRLRANPLARLCIESANRREHLNRMHAQ